MTSKSLWELSGIFLLLAVAASCGAGSTTTTPPFAKASEWGGRPYPEEDVL